MTGVVVLVVVVILLLAGYEALARRSPAVTSPLGRWSGRPAAVRRWRPDGVRRAGADDVAAVLRDARSVLVVPGYGLAVAGGQHALRALGDALAAHGADVRYVVHPAAGRFPGHLATTLDDADVPYAALLPAAEARDRFAVTDVALVVGASDVVDPSSGLDALPVADAAHVVVLTRSAGPGAPDALLHDEKTAVLLGDARASLAAVTAALETAWARAA